MDQDSDDGWTKLMQVMLPDSYSNMDSNMLDEIQRLGREVDCIDPELLPLTTTMSSNSGFGEEEHRQEANQTPDVKLHPTSAPDTLLGQVDKISFDEFGEVITSVPSQANAGEPEEVPNVPQELNQSYERLKNADLFSNETFKANSSSGYYTGTVVHGDDARNAVLQAKEYDGLFDAAERSTPRTLHLDSIDWTDPSYDLSQERIIAESVPVRPPAGVVPLLVYQSNPSYRQWSPRSIHAATPDPRYLRPPNTTTGRQQSLSFDDGSTEAPWISPAHAISMDVAASSRTSSVAPPTVLSKAASPSCLSSTTVSTPVTGDRLRCPVLGCHHKPFTSKSNRARHIRGHDEKFKCRLENCNSVVGRSDNRRTHLERHHKSIRLPPRTSNTRKRNEAGGTKEIVEQCFARIKVG